jgi:hypothetical protein
MRSRGIRRAAAGAVIGCAALLATACGSAAPVTGSGVTGSGAAAATVTVARTTPKVFLAQGQDIRGRALYRPGCRSGCALSGDSTAFLDKMTWRTWSGTKAVGTGIYELNGCEPNCAAGHVYKVPAVVTLSKPVKACLPGGARWFWSRASFRFPKGLPKALQGKNAPLNPWTFSGLIDAAHQSCHR